MKVHSGGESQGGLWGTAPFLVSAEYDCPECGKVHLLEACPHCGSHDIAYDYGLGGGPGVGPYKACGCGWSFKECEPWDENADPVEGFHDTFSHGPLQRRSA